MSCYPFLDHSAELSPIVVSCYPILDRLAGRHPVSAGQGTAVFLLEFRFDPSLAYQPGLLTKLGLTSALLAPAGVNRLILMPRLTDEDSARIWLRRTIAAEILLFMGVIATTAYLTVYLSPHE